MTVLIVGSAALFVAGLAQGCTGFGMAILATPFLMLMMPPALAAPIIWILSTPNTMLVAWDARKYIRPGLFGPLAMGGMLGIPFGVTALERMDPSVLKLGVGLFTAAFAAALLAGWRRPLRDAAWIRGLVGLVSGFTGGSTSMGGPPIILFLSNQNTDKDVFRANIVCHFFLINCVAIGTAYWKGMLSTQLGIYALSFAPAMAVGTFLGMRLSRRVSEAGFQRLVVASALAMGLLLIVTAARALAMAG